jgi:CheY-like chemotaxis protein
VKSVLVLDDDQTLIAVMTRFLEGNAYKVSSAISTEGATQIFQDLQGEVDLLIADLTIDVSSGVEVAAQLKQRTPRLKVLVMSGYPIEAWREQDVLLFNGLPSDSVRTLLKPFSPLDLLLAVEQLIGMGEYLAQPPARNSFSAA